MRQWFTYLPTGRKAYISEREGDIVSMTFLDTGDVEKYLEDDVARLFTTTCMQVGKQYSDGCNTFTCVKETSNGVIMAHGTKYVFYDWHIVPYHFL
jgi:hypothetical protein